MYLSSLGVVVKVSWFITQVKRTKVKDELYGYIHASSGVPQGSVIRPLLFLYISMTSLLYFHHS